MSAKTYTCRRFPSVGQFEYAADFSQSASGIHVRFHGEDGEWQPVPFQVADTRHNRRTAERMIAEYFR
jgi:hypothetical protein